MKSIWQLVLINIFCISIYNTVFSANLPVGKIEQAETFDDKTGATTGIFDRWDIKKEDGSYVYIVYKQDKPIKEPLKLVIEKKDENQNIFKKYDTKFFENDVTSNNKFAMYDLLFIEEGKYKLTVFTKNGKFLAEQESNIAYEKEKSTTSTNSDITSDYYKDSDIKINNKSILSKSNSAVFYLNNDKIELTLKVTNDKAFKTTEVYVSVYKKKYKNGKEDGEDFIDKFTFNSIDLTWDWISLPIEFKEKGDYILDVFTKDDVFINTGFLTIK